MNHHRENARQETALRSTTTSSTRFALQALLLVGGLFLFEVSAVAGVVFQNEIESTVIDGQIHKEKKLGILIRGEITKKDEELLADALWKLGSAEPHVYLDSPGGEIFPAMRMGRVLRSAHATTAVEPGASCSSACVFLLASGVHRFSRFENSRVGLHRPKFPEEMFAGLGVDDAKRYYDKLTADCQKYLREMGMDDKLFADMLRVPSQEIRFVDADYCDSVSLTGVDPAYFEWKRARAIKRLGRDFVERRDAVGKCMASGGGQAECAKRYGITDLDPKDLGAIEDEKEAGARFLAKQAAQKGAAMQPSGFLYKEIREGAGVSPKGTDKVTIHFRAARTDGTIFSSSFDGEPATFPLKGVIPCWTQGIQLMKIGGKARLVCPSDLAYGDAGRAPTVMGGATLDFEIELLSIEK